MVILNLSNWNQTKQQPLPVTLLVDLTLVQVAARKLHTKFAVVLLVSLSIVAVVRLVFQKTGNSANKQLLGGYKTWRFMKKLNRMKRWSKQSQLHNNYGTRIHTRTKSYKSNAALYHEDVAH